MNISVDNMVVRNQITPRPIWVNIPGSTGLTGQTGPTGPIGYGPTGPSYRGSTGPTGPTGLSINYTGITGYTGLTGPNGIGYTGSTGYTGANVIGTTGDTGMTGYNYYGPTGYGHTRTISFTENNTIISNIISPFQAFDKIILDTNETLTPNYYYLTFHFDLNVLTKNIYVLTLNAYLSDIDTNVLTIYYALQQNILPITSAGIYYEAGTTCTCRGSFVFQLTSSTIIRLILQMTYYNEDRSTTINVTVSNAYTYYTPMIGSI